MENVPKINLFYSNVLKIGKIIIAKRLYHLQNFFRINIVLLMLLFNNIILAQLFSDNYIMYGNLNSSFQKSNSSSYSLVGSVNDYISFDNLSHSTNYNLYKFSSNHLNQMSVNSAYSKFKTFHLYNNYPNPFNPVTIIYYSMPEISNISLTLYDMTGREISTLYNGTQIPGYHTINWNASEQSSGIYFVKMVAGDYISTQKLMLIK